MPRKTKDIIGLQQELTPSERAERNIQWCKDWLVLPDGPHIGEQFELPEFMKEDFRAIYANPVGTRRAIISRGRKNAKTFECAMIMLLHLCGLEAIPNSQLYSAAQSRDQAALIFSMAVKMVRMNPDLNEFIQVRETHKTLLCPALGTSYRALSAEASTAYGLNPALIIHDELGQVKGPRSELYEALETAVAAQRAPLSLIISTQARNDTDLLSVLIDDALGAHDKRIVLRFNTANHDMDPFGVEAITAANPAFNDFMNRQEVLAMAEDARRMPAREAEYRNLVLNQRVELSNPFVGRAAWKDCGGPVADISRVPVYAGLDLSSVSDLTAFVMIGRIERAWHVRPTFWLPSKGLHERASQDRVPYDLWHEQGFLKTTPGASVSYEYVAEYLFRMFQEYDIQKLGFDRWNMKHLRPWLIEAGFEEAFIEQRFVQFGQGTQSMSPALRDLEQVIIDKLLVHGNHPVLSMCAANAVIEGKDDANRKLSKNKSSGRIDGMVALAMAMGVAPLTAKPIDVAAMIG